VIQPLSIVVSRTSAGGPAGGAGRPGGATGAPHAATLSASSAVRRTAAAVLLALASGCAPRSLVTRAIHARGGAVEGFVRESEARVYVDFPGDWRWRTAFLLPDRYAWTIFTAGDPDHYLFDGTTVRVFVRTRPVAEEAGAASALRTHARFTAVTNLDALLLPGARVATLADAELPPGAVEGLSVVLADDGSRYRLGFDARALLVHAEGPLALPPLGEGQVVVRYADYRPVAGRLLAHRMEYAFAGRALASERALALCLAPRGLTVEAFQSPEALPDCAVTHGRQPGVGAAASATPNGATEVERHSFPQSTTAPRANNEQSTTSR
jgi:hypothetical protein